MNHHHHPQEDLYDDEKPYVTFSINQGRALVQPTRVPGPVERTRLPGPFDCIEDILNDALEHSSGPSYGGIQHFKVKSFLTRVASSDLFPFLVVKEAIIQPPGLPIGSYQVLSEIRMILDSNFITPPPCPVGEPQGNYVLSEDIFLM